MEVELEREEEREAERSGSSHTRYTAAGCRFMYVCRATQSQRDIEVYVYVNNYTCTALHRRMKVGAQTLV